MKLGILLVHGYTGTTTDLNQLSETLIDSYTESSVCSVLLPGHSEKDHKSSVPRFDEKLFIECIRDSVNRLSEQGEKIILIGHSTGGSLILLYLNQYSFVPFALVLAGTPRQITSQCLSRWESHRPGKKIPLIDTAKMVSLVNRTGKMRFGPFPVQIIHGRKDTLVFPEESFLSTEHNFSGPIRKTMIPNGHHHLFVGKNGCLAVDIVKRFIDDLLKSTSCLLDDIEPLLEIEPEATSFLNISPFSASHLLGSPSGKKILGQPVDFSSYVATEPIVANIEVTTRCNLKCIHCARSFYDIPPQDMSIDTFDDILNLLPHAYQITIVGLGEPLLHPNIVEIIEKASDKQRKVILVTNAILLDTQMSKDILSAGLSGIAFSIDASDPALLLKIRPPSDSYKIIDNINGFIAINRQNRNIPTAVFSSISIDTVHDFEKLTELVADLQVDALMVTDLNFKENLTKTLWKNSTPLVKNQMKKGIANAFSKKIPVISVIALEEFGVAKRYKNFLVMSPNLIINRSSVHTNCCSPWQTICIEVNGDIHVCDCQPNWKIGNILTDPLTLVWNGTDMHHLRTKIRTKNPPPECIICPRF